VSTDKRKTDREAATCSAKLYDALWYGAYVNWVLA